MTGETENEGRNPAGQAPASYALALGVTAAALIAGFFIKFQCTRVVWDGIQQYANLCYNDLQPLYHHRYLIQGLVPYADTPLEYPVLTGTFMWAMAALLEAIGAITGPEAVNDGNYFLLSVWGLAPFAFAVTLILRPVTTRNRLMIWAAGTPLALYAFHNWDLIAVALATWALVLAERRNSAGAGAALGLGASAKLYPAFLAPLVFFDLVRTRVRGGALKLTAGFAAAAAAANVPWMVVNFERWMGIWTFHADRYPDFGTVWYWIAQRGNAINPSAWWQPGEAGYRDLVSILSLVLFGLGALAFVAVAWRRPAGLRPSAPALGMGVVALFLLVSKVHSPQYALWLAPLFAMVSIPLRWVVLYLAGDLGVFVSGFLWFTQLNEADQWWKGPFEVAVIVRAAALAIIVLQSLKVRRVRPAGAGEDGGPGAAAPAPPAGEREGEAAPAS